MVKVCVGMTQKSFLMKKIGFGKIVKDLIKNDTICVPAKKIFLHPLLGTKEVWNSLKRLDGVKFNL